MVCSNQSTYQYLNGNSVVSNVRSAITGFFHSAQKMTPTVKKTIKVFSAALATAGVVITAASCLAFLAAKVTVALPFVIAGVAVGVSCLAAGILLYAVPKAIASYIQHKKDAFPEQRMLYHKVGDSGDKIEELEGAQYTETISSIIDDLKAYKKSKKSDDQCVDQLVNDLEFTLEIDKANYRYLPNFMLNMFHENERMAGEISAKIQKLDNSSSVIIPGGSKGHAVLYQIKREADGLLSFTIIDTGGFVNQSGLYEKASHDEDVGSVDGRLSKHRHTYNPTYTGLTEEQLSEEFILQLLQKNYEPSFIDNLKFMDKHLRNESGSNVKYEYTQRLQHNGTCSMKSILGLLRNELGKEEYRKFKVFMTQRELKKLSSRSTSTLSNLKDFVFTRGKKSNLDREMLFHSTVTLGKRKAKANDVDLSKKRQSDSIS